MALIVLDVWVWVLIFGYHPTKEPILDFLNVGQGDSTMLSLPHGVRILTDAGPDTKVMSALQAISPNNKHIDLAVITHPQLDHFNGFLSILDAYSVGAFIINGRADGPMVYEWPLLIKKIQEKQIPIIILGAGDKIRYENNLISFLSPNEAFRASGELNDTGFVTRIDAPPLTALLTADTGMNVEQHLIDRHFLEQADILKIGHHGSKYSTSDVFLEALRPRVAVIEVGAKNRYGHPTKETLDRLAEHDVRVFRTDQNGTVEIRENPISRQLTVSSL